MGTVPSLFVDLRNSASQKWYSCKLSRGNQDSTCCGIMIGNNDQCIEFKVLVHPNTQALILEIPESSEQEWQDDRSWWNSLSNPCPPVSPPDICQDPAPSSPGAKPSINTYRINCGSLQGGAQGDDPACLTSSIVNDTIFITFCQTGNNANVYRLRTIEGDLNAGNLIIQQGACGGSVTIQSQDIDISTLTWSSNDHPSYDAFLNSTMGDTTVIVTVPNGDPLTYATWISGVPYLSYEVCGEIVGHSVCTNLQPVCATALVAIIQPPTVVVDDVWGCPADATYPVEAVHPGRDNYEFYWFDGPDPNVDPLLNNPPNPLGDWDWDYTSAGTKSVVVRDITVAALGLDPDCTLDTVVFDIHLYPVPPAQITGPPLICKFVEYSFTALNAGAGATYDWDFGAGASPATYSGTGTSGRNPPDVEYSTCGDKTITLTVTSADGCDSTTMITVPGDALAPDLSSCNLTNPTVECGGTAQNNTNIIAWHNANLAELQNCAVDQCAIWVFSDFDLDDFTPDPTCGGGTTAGSITVEYRVTDSCQSSFITATYTIEDNTPPVVSIGEIPNLSFECVGLIPAPDTNIVVDETCGSVTRLWLGDSPSGNPCNLVITRSYRVIDACDNVLDTNQIFTINDITPPTISCPSQVDLEGCDESILASTAAINNWEFSTSIRPIDLVDFQNIGGAAGDNCGIDSLYYFDAQTGTCPIVITRTFVVVDSCNLSNSCTQLITVDDNTNPSITCPGPETIEGCDVSILATAPSIGGLEFSTTIRIITLPDLTSLGGTASDFCGIDSLYYRDVQSGTCPIVVTRTFTVVDLCGNTDQCTQTIQVDDTTDPIISCPGGVSIEGCNVDALATAGSVGNLEYSEVARLINLSDLTSQGGSASDLCGIDSLYYRDSQTGSCPIVITRTFVVVDSCGNRTECDQIIQVDDTTNPQLTCPANQNLELCGVYDLGTVAVLGNLEYSESIRFLTIGELQGAGGDATDECGIDSLYYFDVQSGSCPTTITRTFVVTDSCVNRVTCIQTITIDDTTIPLLTCPADDIIEACSAQDLASSPQVGNLEYSEVPRLILVADIQGLGGDASDNCGIDSLYYVDAQSGTCPIVITRIFTVVDSCGNRISCPQIIQIDDTTDPLLTCPGDQVIEACLVGDLDTSTLVGNLSFSPGITSITVLDIQNAGGDASDVCGIDSLYYFDTRTGTCPIVITRTFVAVDSCGNRSTCQQQIDIDDTTDPEITCPGPVVLEGCNVGFLASEPLVGNLEYSEAIRIITLLDLTNLGGTASDICGIDSLYYFDQQSSSCPIVITRTFAVVDSCGNRVTCEQEIQLDDTTDPTITCPGNQIIEACGVYDLATEPAVGNLEYSEVARAITLADLIGLGGTANDECGIDSLYYFDSQSGSCPIIVTRTFVVVDSCGNRQDCTQEIQIDDTTSPILNCPADQSLELCGVYDLANSATVGNLEYSEVPRSITVFDLQGIGGSASDECNLDSLYYYDIQVGTCPIVVTRTFVATDSCGNRSECPQIITIDDTTDPILVCPADDLIEACGVEDLSTSAQVGNLEFSEIPRIITTGDIQSIGGDASDNCGLDSLYYFDIQAGSCPIIVTRTYVAVDTCGNRVQCSQEILIDDTTDPVLTCPLDEIIEGCDESFLATSASVGNLEYSEVVRPITVADIQGIGGDASDNCSIDSLYYVDVQTGFCPIIITRTFVVVDTCGNRVECDQEIQINDTTDPLITCPGDLVLEACDVGFLATSPTVGNLEYSEIVRPITLAELQNLGGTASDECGIDSLYYYDTQSGSCPIIITRTFVVVDSCGNQVDCIQEIQINDTTDPTITCPGPQVIEACGVYDLATSAQVGNLEYSEVPRIITLVELQALGGDAADPCGIDSLFYFDVQSGNCPITVTRTFVVVDSCGNRVDCVQEIQIDDTTAPVILCPADQNLELCGVYDLANSAAVGNLEYSESPRSISILELQALGGDASDGCNLDSLYYFDSQTGNCPIVVTRTFVATDSCGNRVDCPQEIIIDDTTDPLLTCPADDIIEACGVDDLALSPQVGNMEYSESPRPLSVAEIQSLGGSVSDNCGLDSLYYVDARTGSCPIIVTRTFVAVDSCGNRVECDQEIQIDDSTAPTVICPEDQVIEGCDESILATSGQVGSLEYSQTIRLITIADLQSIGGDASDNCIVDSLYYFDVMTGFCPIVITRTFVAVDSCGNRSECVQEIQVIDTTVPIISCPADVQLEACGVGDLATSAAVGNLEFSTQPRVITVLELQGIGGNASDNCGIDSLYYRDVAVENCPIIITRTFVVVDSCGNRAECTQEIQIDDTTDPTLTCPANQILEACGVYQLVLAPEVGNLEYSEAPRIVTLVELQGIGGDAGDLCGIDSLYYRDVQTGSCPIIVTRTFVVTDSCGNRVECDQEIQIDDTTLPIISCPADLVLERCNVGDLATSTEVGNLEYSAGVREVTLSEYLALGGTASDECGIDSLYYRDVQVGTCPIIITRTFVVTDSCGNRSECQQEIQIDDTTDPILSCPSAVDIEGCSVDDLAGAIQVGNLEFSNVIRSITSTELQAAGGSVSDNCGIDSLFYFDNRLGSCPIEITRTFVAVDSCGNRVECTQDIQIDDTFSPSIICPANASLVGCDVNSLASSGTVGNLEFSTGARPISVSDIQGLGGDASDNCFIDSLYYRDEVTGNCPIIVTRTFTAVDSCGNRIECSYDIEIDNREEPVVVCPPDQILEACDVSDLALATQVGQFGYSEDPVTITLSELVALGGSASDNCGIERIEYQDAVIDDNCPILIERSFTVYDSCGLTTECVQSIQIIDTESPSIICPPEQGFTCYGDLPTRVITLTAFEAIGGVVTDNCSVDPASFQWLGDQSDGNKCPEIITRTYQIADWCGNTELCIQTFIIHDTIPPQFSGIPEDVTVPCDEVPDPPQVGLQIQVTDNCGEPNVTYFQDSIPGVCENTYDLIRTWTATDSCGNIQIASQQITVIDCRPIVQIQINPNPVCLGHDVTLTATVTGNYTNPVYRWQIFSSGFWVNVPGGDALTHIITNIQLNQEGIYRFVVADGIGNLDNENCNAISEEIELIIIRPSVTDLVEAICEGQSYTVGNSTYNTTGNYTDILIGPNGCDSIVNLDLTVNPHTTATVDPIICEGESYIIGSSVLNETGTYVETITNANGCDSVVTVNLTVIQPTTTTVQETICEGNSIDVAGETFSSEGNFTVILTDQFGCDSIISVQINVIPPVIEELEVTVCDGVSFEAAGNFHRTAGNYQYTLVSQQTGCDSILNLTLIVVEDIEVTLDVTICIGDSIQVGSNFYNETGTYVETLIAGAGCDSIVTLNLAVVDTIKTDLDITLCDGDSYTMAGQDYAVTGTYQALIPSSAGCDSLITLNLTVNPNRDTSFSANLCAGEFINVAGEILNATGNYNITTTTQSGCDSNIVVDLVVFDPYDTTHVLEICQGDSVTFGIETYSETGIYTQQHLTQNGCDSIIIVDLTVHPIYMIDLVERICLGETYTVGTNTYSTSGVYLDSLSTQNGCDSIIMLDLMVLSEIRNTQRIQICQGDSYTLGSSVYNTTGTYEESFISTAGCDSIVTLFLEVLDQLNTELNEQICEGQTYDFDGDLTSTSGIFTKTYTSQAGCDSVVTLNLQVLSVLRTSLNESICAGESYFFDGQQLTSSSIYYDTLTSSLGCDSIVSLDLMVLDTVVTNLTEQLCVGEVYDFGAQQLTQDGNYQEVLTTSSGCDSVVNLQLTFVDEIRDTLNVQICVGESFSLGSQSYNQTGSYEETFTSSLGCDSVVTLLLVVNDQLETTLNETICSGQSYSFFTQTLTTAGSYTHTLTSQAGCDSVITLELEVKSEITQDLVIDLCPGESYFFNDQELSLPGTYTGIYTSQGGCDSIVNLLLSFIDINETFTSVSLCEGETYPFGNELLDSTGTYRDTLISALGCDSISIVDLQVNQHKRDTIFAQICEGQSYEFFGEQYSISGNYDQMLITQAGCDSLITLALTVNDQLFSSLDTTICQDASLDFFGTTITSAGAYMHTLPSVAGCDSVITLNVEVIDQITNQFEVQLCNGQTYDFDGQTLSTDGQYSATYLSKAGCDSVVIVDLVTKDVLTTDLMERRCVGELYQFGLLAIDSAGVYRDTLTSSLGCDSIVTLQIEFFDILRDTIFAEICDGQVYSFNGTDYSSTGFYEHTSTSSLGCDSITALDLLVNTVLTTTIDTQICFGQPLAYQGELYTTSGIYQHSFISNLGCDSIVTIDLTVLNEIRTQEDQQICRGASIVFDGETLTDPGLYLDTLTASNGCDSIIELSLSVVDEIIEIIDLTLCSGDSVQVNGIHYATSGYFEDTLASSGGCDSILQITVEIVEEKFERITHTMCEGEEYTFGDDQLTTIGFYYDTLSTSGGCDSIVELELIVLPSSVQDLTVNICEGQVYFVGSDAFSSSGTYEVTLVNTAGCDSTINLNLIVSNEIVTEQTIQVCAGDTVSVDGTTYDQAGTYRDTLLSSAGCDSISILHIEFVDFITMELSYDLCPGDSIEINGHYHTQDTLFQETYSSVFGCDSIVTYTVQILPDVDLEVLPQTICEGESVSLSVIGSNYQTLQWSPSATLSCDDCPDPVASPLQTTTYTLTTIGCGDSEMTTEVTVEVVPLPGLVMPEDQVIANGSQVILSASVLNEESSISWYNTNDGALICEDCPMTIQQPSSTTTYRAQAVNSLDCPEEGLVTITVEGLCDFEKITATNAFTPNGDGFNDYFEIRNDGVSTIALVEIFNRWGELVFSSSSVDLLWDGTYKGQPVNPGVYMYTIRGVCQSEQDFLLAGNVTVLR